MEKAVQVIIGIAQEVTQYEIINKKFSSFFELNFYLFYSISCSF